MAELIPPKAPNLPLAPREYEFRYSDQLNNVLRLYFNTIDNAVQETSLQTTSNTVLIWMDM